MAKRKRRAVKARSTRKKRTAPKRGTAPKRARRKKGEPLLSVGRVQRNELQQSIGRSRNGGPLRNATPPVRLVPRGRSSWATIRKQHSDIPAVAVA
jgi:hypothetical protein